ncbi:hypothetical protein [Deinococcus ruber]|uniref:Uncharacterized protein n=1 Tax=Deinococcus ruber TaxID=1848197 RepID=A0A918CPA9_9DEIO|nr:hypothetical protein [Deinococcus ruber]GGR33609.1 hypothetical protein GCM10008957_49820 [Deinococcus ruber]
MRQPKVIRSALALIAVFSLSSGFADKYEDQVRSNLQDRYDYWYNKGGGWTQIPDLRDMDVVHEDHYITVTYTLVAGRTYKIVGACDNDCDNLDLELRDDNGNLIDRDDADDDIPIVDVTPKRTGDFKLKVIMSGCASQNGCEYGVDVYRAR